VDDARRIAEERFYEGVELFAVGKHEEAIAKYRESVSADATFADALHGLVRAYQDLERYDEAIAIAQRLSALDPDDILPHTSLSILYQKKGMIAEAEAEANRARVLGWKQELKTRK